MTLKHASEASRLQLQINTALIAETRNYTERHTLEAYARLRGARDLAASVLYLAGVFASLEDCRAHADKVIDAAERDFTNRKAKA